MKTKFLLIGGYIWKAPDGGKAYAEELVRGFEEPAKILVCLFARPEEDWPKLFKEDQDFFAKHLFGVDLEVQLAQPGTFIDQLKWANAIYFRGGSMDTLLSRLTQSPNWQKFLDGKTISGASAGAQLFSKEYYSLSKQRVEQGLGILPLKVLAHYKSDFNGPDFDWDKAYQELKDYGDQDAPLWTLPEGEYHVIESERLNS